MGVRGEYAPGVFCWVELATSELSVAQAFYQDVFGWSVDEPDPGQGYAYARLGGAVVAGARPLDPAERERRVPAHWFNYVSVDDVDATCARARELGGEVLTAAHDVPEMGRCATVRDPGGAPLGLWGPPRAWPGAERVNDPGCLAWNELGTLDPATASEFYSGLFGWGFERHDEDGQPYWTIKHDGAAGAINGGMRELTAPERQAEIPPFWLPYFTVASIDEAFDRVASGGGERMAGPMSVAVGRVGVLHDPQGAVFAVYEGDVDD